MPQRPAGTVTRTVVSSGQCPAGRKTSVVGVTAFHVPWTLGVMRGWAVFAASGVENRTTSFWANDTFCAPRRGRTEITLTATTGVGLDAGVLEADAAPAGPAAATPPQPASATTSASEVRATARPATAAGAPRPGAHRATPNSRAVTPRMVAMP